MKVALIGFGAMGKLVASLAEAEGHEIGARVTSRESSMSAEDLGASLQGHDVAVDFSVAQAVPRNTEACCLAGVPLVQGTTGWNAHEQSVRESVAKRQGALVYGANFSLGVNLFYRIVQHASSLFAVAPGYDPFIEEAHHARKRDAPSGTALRLRNLMTEKLKCEVPVTSIRAGYIPGTHRIGFDSIADQIELTHTARSREGFASGALLAARWVPGRKGVFEFSQVIDEIIERSLL
jgi:4-hydroxy-tetrahydrodipicolinate reductase